VVDDVEPNPFGGRSGTATSRRGHRFVTGVSPAAGSVDTRGFHAAEPPSTPRILPAVRLALLAVCLCALAPLVAGCRSAPTPVDWAREYPVDLVRAPKPLDIQVFRNARTLEFSNTTAKALPAGTLWINRRFALPFDGLAVGATFERPLTDFRDEFSDPFRAGGFFAREAPDTVVMVELEVPAEQGPASVESFIVVKGTPD
jgi:hypothetical protein